MASISLKRLRRSKNRIGQDKKYKGFNQKNERNNTYTLTHTRVLETIPLIVTVFVTLSII